MKNHHLFFFFLALIVAGCGAPTTDQHSILVDITTPGAEMPDSTSIKNSLAIQEDKWAGTSFALATISDVGYNPKCECKIAPASSLLDNLVERNHEVRQFWNCYRSAWKLLNDTLGREHSSVFQPIVYELELLLGSPATTKNLVVYSDLQEHSSVFSVHDPQDFALLKKNPKAVLERLEAKTPIPSSLAGITIQFIYRPLHPDDDERFSLMANLLRDAFVAHGATVTISTSIRIALD